MKILFIRNTDRISGSETYDINLLKELKIKSTFDITFFSSLPSLVERMSGLGISSYVTFWAKEGIGTKKQLLRELMRLPVTIYRYLIAIHKFEINGHFDLICLQSMTEKIFLSPLLKIFGYKVIWTELGAIYATRMSRVVTFLYRVSSLFVTKIIAIAEDTKLDLIKGGVPAKKVEVIYIGIDIEQFGPFGVSKIKKLRKKFQIPPTMLVLCFLGTITDEKGIIDFVKISDSLLKQTYNYFFVIIGDGPDLPWVKKRVKNLKIDSFYMFTGFANDVRPYLGISDILFLPTHHFEGTPLAILEAQAMGKTVITSNMGGNKEIVNSGKNGYIYFEFNEARITNLITDLAKNKSKRNLLGDNARKNILSRFNIQIQTNKFINLFLQIYENRR